MATIIQFPKNLRTESFYRFLVRWSDGMQFIGSSLEECFRKQKDMFEPEYSMDEYLDRFRARLLAVTGIYYHYTDVAGLVDVLVENGYLEVIRKDGLEEKV
jgi:hypothetical protein